MSFGTPGAPQGPPEPRRIPQWKLDEMAQAGGRPVRSSPEPEPSPSPWRGYSVPLLDVSAPVPPSRSGRAGGRARGPGRGVGVILAILGVSFALSAASYNGMPHLKRALDLMNPPAAPPLVWKDPRPTPAVPGIPAPVIPKPGVPAAPPVVAAAPAAPADDHDQAPAQQLEKSDDGPTPGREEAYQPLGRPAPLASTSDSYAFVGGGRPGQAMVAYSPCRPIHYVVRPDNAPPGGQQIIAESVAAVSRATGLKFVFDGPTSEGPSAERDAFQPGLYGDRWAPVLVSWTTEQESPQLVSGSSGEGRLKTLGLAGSTAVAYGEDPYVYVSGQVKLNAPALAEGEGQSGPGFISSVVAHELAHVVGLEHVDDPTQLMYPQAGPERLVFAAGDLTGLAKLGRGPCAPNV